MTRKAVSKGSLSNKGFAYNKENTLFLVILKLMGK